MHISTSNKAKVPPILGLIVGILAVSTAATFIRLAQGSVSSLAVAAWRLTLASLLLAPFALSSKRAEWSRLTRREWGWLWMSGAFLALHFYTWIVSLEMTSVAASVVLVATGPFFVGIISHFFLDERLTCWMVIGMSIAFVGTVIISVGDVYAGSHRLVGDGLAVVGAMAVAGYMLIGRRLRKRLSLLGYVFPVYGTAAVILMGAALLSRTPMWGYAGDTWLWLLLVALFPQIIGHSAFNWALEYLPATYVSLATLVEPIGSALLAWFILREVSSSAALGGGVLILLGMALATWRKAEKRGPGLKPRAKRAKP